MRTQIVLFGDSLVQGTGPVGTAESYGQGGQGSWWELVRDRLASIPGVGPLLSAGMRMTSLGYGAQPTEWTFSGSQTAVASTDAFDKVPYGGSGIQGFRYGAGASKINTWTKPTGMPPIVGFAVDFIDYSGGGNWRYRIDGGAWVNHGQTLLNDNVWTRFYVASAVTSTVEFQASSDGTTAAGMFIVAIEPYFSTATSGLTIHNLAINGSKLHELTLATSGDRLAVLDSVRLGTGSPVAPYANGGVINMNINDVLLASTATWDTDETALRARVPSRLLLGLMNPWECGTGSFNQTQQTNYRAHTKTNAAAFSPVSPVLDFYDAWSALGFTANAGANTAGFVFDNTHLTQAGQIDVAARVYPWILNNFFTIGKAGSIFSVGSSTLGTSTALLGGQVETILPDGTAIAVTGGTPVVHATNTITPAGKAIAVTGGSPTIHAANTLSPTGHAISVTGGTPTIHATATISPAGLAVQVVGGGPLAVVGPGTIPAFGHAIVVTGGSPTITPGPVTITATGLAVAVVGGAATLHAVSQVVAAGNAILVTGGSPSIAVGPVVIHLAGVPIVVSGGTPTFSGGVSEPASVTVSVIPSMRATVTVVPHATATVSV